MYLPLFRVGSGASKLLSLYINSLFLVTGLLPPASCSADDRPCVELPSWTSQTSTSSSTTTTWTADMLYGIDAGTTGRSTMDLDYGRSTEYNPYDKKADDPMSPISRRLQGGNVSKLHELVTTLSAVCCLATLAFMMPAIKTEQDKVEAIASHQHGTQQTRERIRSEHGPTKWFAGPFSQISIQHNSVQPPSCDLEELHAY